MLIAFLIMLREGIEAALIVGIVAGFLKQSGHHHLMNKVWLGVISAALLCVGIGLAIHRLTGEIPQKEQEFVVGAIGLVAVGMLTYMVLWMQKAARSMKQQLQDSVQTALNRGNGQGWALVGMAFLAVAREGSITRASERLFLSQPAISAHIKAMEDELGIALFERTPRGMSLTANGAQLLERAGRIMALHREFIEEARRIKGRISGRVRLGAIRNPSARVLGRLSARLSHACPDIEVALTHGTSGEIARAIRGAEARHQAFKRTMG